MRKFDKILLIFAVLVLVSALIFVPKAKIRFFKTEIVFMQWWENETQKDKLKELIERFEIENTGIKVKLKTMPPLDIKSAIYAAMENNSGAPEHSPDIIAIDPAWFDAPDTIEIFEDISNLTSEPDPSSKKTLTVLSFIKPLYYNISSLSNAGFDRPPKTQEDFLAVCRELKKNNGTVFSISNKYFNELFSWLLNRGIDWTKYKQDNPEKQDFDFQDAGFVSALDFFKTMYNEKLFAVNTSIQDRKI
ncbi:MAG: ABC transporter substrate-binding protein, partial [Spirochaetaceae bacterium]|nr:ABC transporter substrate-binding protein [Spirochaetaceae bacterium]